MFPFHFFSRTGCIYIQRTIWGGTCNCALVVDMLDTRVKFVYWLMAMIRNAPIILAMRAILFPLAAGNTVIFKSSELSPRTHLMLASFFAEAGFPPGVVNVIGHTRQDGAEITEALISQREVKKINFTGSTIVGRKIAAKAGEHLKPVLLELGGKGSLIVLEDADIEKAAEAAVFGSFLHVSAIVCALLGEFLAITTCSRWPIPNGDDYNC